MAATGWLVIAMDDDDDDALSAQCPPLQTKPTPPNTCLKSYARSDAQKQKREKIN